MRITQKHIFFWKESYSQWYIQNFTDPVSGITFNCAEQFMMWYKAMLFNDIAMANKILKEKEPREQKKMGREVKGYNQKIWDENKFNIVCNATMLKFTQNPRLLSMLLETGNKILVEASPLDEIWGIKMAENDEGVDDPVNWKGENLLGYALVNVREHIREILLSTNNLYPVYGK